MLEFDSETDLRISANRIVDSDEVIPGCIVDFDKNNRIVGLEFLKHATIFGNRERGFKSGIDFRRPVVFGIRSGWFRSVSHSWAEE